MALDRFVRWQKKKPTTQELRTVLEDYLGGIGKIENMGKKGNTWWSVTLPGKPTFPFRRLEGFENRGKAIDEIKERWFEVYVDKKYVDVMTRHGDELTGNIAQGFAELLTRFWEAKLEV